MTDSISDILGDYVVSRSVKAVRLDDPATLARVGRWLNENGVNCTWISASGATAMARAGENANMLWIHSADGQRTDSARIGDWVVHVAGSEFLLVSDANFSAVYKPVSEIRS